MGNNDIFVELAKGVVKEVTGPVVKWLFQSRGKPQGAIVDSNPALDSLVKVCVFRPVRFLGGGRGVEVYFDDVKLVNIRTNEHFFAYVRPGRHVFSCEKKAVIDLVFVQAQTYYLEVNLASWNDKNCLSVATLETWQGRRRGLEPVPARRVYSGGGVKIIER